jgi:hypothetical protein
LRGADHTQHADNVALHRVAQSLRARCEKRDRNPNPADGIANLCSPLYRA